MTQRNNNSLMIALVVVLVLFLFGGFFGGYGFSMMGSGYGFNRMCSMMGGIWCYWPGPGAGIVMWLFMTLVVVALVLFIVWLVRQLQNPQMRE